MQDHHTFSSAPPGETVSTTLSLISLSECRNVSALWERAEVSPNLLMWCKSLICSSQLRSACGPGVRTHTDKAVLTYICKCVNTETYIL